MKPTTLKERYNKNTDSLLEEDTFDQNDGMSDEDLKIESLKIATNICKLMNDVLPEDIIEVAEKVAQFIKNGGDLTVTTSSDSDDTSDDSTDDEITSDFEEDFDTDDNSDDTESNDEDGTSSESNDEDESEEDFEV